MNITTKNNGAKSKKTKKQIILTIVLLCLNLWTATIQAQQSTTTVGGNALGSGGNITYSVGQVICTTNAGLNGSITQGVQQPYEILSVLGVENHQISLNFQVYPNPTTDYLTLNMGNTELLNLHFQLFDINGKLIEIKKITNTIETIQMTNLPIATYFLKVVNYNKEIKTFKIMKN
ncbi:MAG: T9SS type A sorting domain-containing protein [Flavobacterium sp.]|nr:T9SS type A sorting domain-containing protein [Flavobacterium sp.]